MKKMLLILFIIPTLLLSETEFANIDSTKSKNIIPIIVEKNYTRSAIESASFITGLWAYNCYIAKEKWAVIGFNQENSSGLAPGSTGKFENLGFHLTH